MPTVLPQLLFAIIMHLMAGIVTRLHLPTTVASSQNCMEKPEIVLDWLSKGCTLALNIIIITSNHSCSELVFKAAI